MESASKHTQRKMEEMGSGQGSPGERSAGKMNVLGRPLHCGHLKVKRKCPLGAQGESSLFPVSQWCEWTLIYSVLPGEEHNLESQ